MNDRQRWDRYAIDGIRPPMQKRTRPFPWRELFLAALWTIGCAAFVVAVFKAGS